MPTIIEIPETHTRTSVQGKSPEKVAAELGIPVITEITPRPDPVYGHTFKWPEEVPQFLEMRQAEKETHV